MSPSFGYDGESAIGKEDAVRIMFRHARPIVFAGLLLTALAAAARAQDGAAASAPATTNVCIQHPVVGSAPSAGGVATAPLTVSSSSHVVVMEYEAWFGRDTGIAPQPQVTTCLQSSDMTALGGGYDSTDPTVIAQHVAWLQQMGVDAVTVDVTNNVSCIFDGDNAAIIKQVCPDPAFRAQNVNIARNSVNLYPAWTKLGTPLKLIPLLGGFDPYALTPDQDDPQQRTALEKEADDFATRMDRYGALDVVFGGKPLMLIYLGTPIDPARAKAIVAMLHASGLDERFTFRLIGGYLDSQPTFWADPNATPDGPLEIAPKFGFWSIVDRINFWGAPPAPYYPTYTKLGPRVETMTASLATAGQNGWNCAANPNGHRYCPDAALRYCGEGFQNGCKTGDYETLGEFMRYAETLQPIFLIVDQFNEFAQPDEGWNANTNDDAEPTRQWGYGGIRAVMDAIASYRASATP